MSTMLAYTYSRYGPPEVLRQVEMARPSPKPDEVLVRIYATSVSAADWRMRSLTMPPGLGWIGRPAIGLFGPRKPVLGVEFSGVVAHLGSAVTRFKAGDAVIGFPGVDLGAHAQYIVMPATGKLTHKPTNLSHIAAAAVPFGATTAYDYLVNKGKLAAGETLLINGASGSVGSACVQIAKHIGAKVTAVCSARNARLVLDLGADRVLDYEAQDFGAESLRYDVVVDTVGTAPWSRVGPVLRPGGRMLLIAGKASDMVFGGLKARMAGKRLCAGVARESRDSLETVVGLAAKGVFRPVIDRCFSFDEMIEAHRHVDRGHKVGNVVVRVHGDPDAH